MKSFMANPSKVERKWYVVDAEGKTLGRLASEVANVLRGKKKPIYTPHIDTGDYVIVVNAEKVKTTGKKANKKLVWTTSNKKYATVNSKGVVTAKKAGKGRTVKITAKATDGSKKSASVKIKIK